jgi:hypothetical protein
MIAGGALAGFVLAQMVANMVPEVNDPLIEGAILLTSATLHSSIDGDDEIAILGRSASLGLALFQGQQLAARGGQLLQNKRLSGDNPGMNRVYDMAAKALLPQSEYVGASPAFTETPSEITAATMNRILSARSPAARALNSAPDTVAFSALM